MNRRTVARACIAVGLACIAGTVILAGLPGHHAEALGFSTCASGVLAIGGGLTYLRSTGRAVTGRHDTGESDRAAWQSARILADLGELTARWLEGSLSSVPGYYGPPDEETVPLVPVLARLNRAGFVTTGSQPGLIEEGAQGTRLEQRGRRGVRQLAARGDAAARRPESRAAHRPP